VLVPEDALHRQQLPSRFQQSPIDTSVCGQFTLRACDIAEWYLLTTSAEHSSAAFAVPGTTWREIIGTTLAADVHFTDAKYAFVGAL
jgi:hypothetical protein